jgi:hypothetical protein
VRPETFAICRLAPDAAFPAWVLHADAGFFSITRSEHEISIVCAEDDLPPSVERVERGWRALFVEGAMVLDAVGVLAALSAPLAAAGIPLFAISTYDTDYLLVKAENLERAVEALRKEFAVVE